MRLVSSLADTLGAVERTVREGLAEPAVELPTHLAAAIEGPLAELRALLADARAMVDGERAAQLRLAHQVAGPGASDEALRRQMDRLDDANLAAAGDEAAIGRFAREMAGPGASEAEVQEQVEALRADARAWARRRE